MKIVKMAPLLVLLGVPAVFAQWSGYTLPEGNELDAGLGMTWIDSHSYFSFSFCPDISIGKFGLGLGIHVLYDIEKGGLRAEDWDESYDYLRLIRYLRWGHKGDPLYARIGALDAERIGHGFLLGYYNNQIDYDGRKIGLTCDADFGYTGFESLLSNMGRLEILGGRVYFRPIYVSRIPVLRNFAVGASFVSDFDPDGRKATSDGVAAFGADAELPLIKAGFMQLVVYTDYAKIIDYGQGATAGARLDFDGLLRLLTFGVSVERRFLGKEFVASYFGPFYEVMRHTTFAELVDYYESMGGDSAALPRDFVPPDRSALVNKHTLLPMMNENRFGWFAGLYVDLLRLVRVVGAFEMLDGEGQSGSLHIGAGLSQSVPFIAFEASYEKWGIRTLSDIRTLDYRSVARVGAGYKITPFLLLYLDYIWSFEWDESLGQYKPQERFEPRIAFRYSFR